MTFEDVLQEPSDKEKILEFIWELEREHPYKVQGDPETYCSYNEAWTDALDRVENFINSL